MHQKLVPEPFFYLSKQCIFSVSLMMSCETFSASLMMSCIQSQLPLILVLKSRRNNNLMNHLCEKALHPE